MVKIVLGTTPTIKYKFAVVDPADFSEAIMTIKDSRKQAHRTTGTHGKKGVNP